MLKQGMLYVHMLVRLSFLISTPIPLDEFEAALSLLL